MTDGTQRQVDTLRYGWKFTREEMLGATAADFDDSGWQTVRVPHDWAIAGPFDRENDVHVTRIIQDGEAEDRRHTGRTAGLPHVGKGWYRLAFDLPADIASRRVRIEFDGVMSHSNVYCNGKHVGGWPYGYSSFAFELTEFVKPGENTLAVTVDNPEHSSRWYPGAGIFRHVRLVTLAPTHIAHWGTYITTPAIDEDSATVRIRTEIACGTPGNIELETTFIDPTGAEVAAVANTREMTEDGVFAQEATIASPLLWSTEMPQLYVARSVVKVDGAVVDCVDTPFGIRSLRFCAKTGFYLNGVRTRLDGVCMHHDLGPLGSAINRAALKRQLDILKDMRCNSIRTSHNPPAPELLELADEMGILILDEAFDEWRLRKCENGYHTLFQEWAEKDLRALIRRDRNHPSVIMWSLGNEIPEQHDAENGNQVCTFLHDIAHDEDPTRPTTCGFNNTEQAIRNGLADTVDVPGWNYKPYWYARYHGENPDMPMYGSETSSCISSRGEYYFPVEEEKDPIRETLQVNSYDLSSPGWAGCPDVEFRGVDENPWIMGEYVWTGFDYLGEPTPYGTQWPSRSSYFGIVDLCGIPKDRFYLYQSRWADQGTLHLLPHWTWPGGEGECTPVHCYSSWDTVELFVNGVSQGKRTKHIKHLLGKYRLVWSGVTYAPGELKAVAYDGKGNAVRETTVRTAGAPAAIRLTPDRANMAADGLD
ncbi:MAG: glycoside hydrolase family 2 protein, partial [Victivallales bacterium]|nr:glycoside hydrolase family 2 protein [Victivallales bacterium]